MHSNRLRLAANCLAIFQRNFKLSAPHYQSHLSHHFYLPHSFSNLVKIHAFHMQHASGSLLFPQGSENESTHINTIALKLQNLLKDFSKSSNDEFERALDEFVGSVSGGLVLNVLRRHNSDWNSAFRFFNWVSKRCNPNGYSPGSEACNEMLGILGKMKRFDEVHQVLDEMSKRGLMNERSYEIVVHRYASAHRTADAIEFFYKRKQYGLKIDLIAFQRLLMSLCRYKHVEDAEFLFHSKKGEFQYDIKTWNIILNGWCVMGSLRETKRFWKEIMRSECKPDKFTYATFISCLCKWGKISTAVKLFHALWEKGCTLDVVICNSVIDGLCFKKRVPEALQIFREMNDKDCPPNAATYNCLVKHLCKIQRMEKVLELLVEMEEKGESCSPNATTYSYLLSSSKKPEEVLKILERMKKTGCNMTGDTYNLLLRLYMKWNCEEQVQSTWAEMERDGVGPDQRSYSIMIHGLYDHERLEDAMNYFNEMTSKGMTPGKRTVLLVDAMRLKLEGGAHENTDNKVSMHARKRKRKNISFVR